MKFFAFFCILIFLSSCASTSSSLELTTEDVSIVGTWNLVSFIDHPNGKTEWESHPDNIIYQKHLTGTHFTWVQYDTEQDLLLGMGGGNYSTAENKYIENIDFFYPPASSELGQSIPFDMEFKDGKWYHTGFAKVMEIDFETGGMIATDSSKIEEIWTKSTDEMAQNSDLMGTWALKQYRDNLDGTYYEYPEMTGYIKLITPTHFAWTRYDKDGDQIYTAGTGTYQFDGETYTETVQVIYPQGSGIIGETIDFSINLNAYKWEHFGYIPVSKPDEPLDTLLIDEIWNFHVPTLEEEVGVSF